MEISKHHDLVIPVEIIFAIIDDLSSIRDLHTLMSFSQTCHLFSIPCRKHIFSKIAIGLRQESLDSGILLISVPNMEKIFSSTPTVANYIRRAMINVANPSLDGDLLLSLLQQLDSLASLRLTSEMLWSIHDFSEDWRDIKPTMAQCVTFLLQLPSLVELEIFRLQGIPISTFSGIPNVKHLRLHASTITWRHAPESLTPGQRHPPLTLLDVRGKSINSLHRTLSKSQTYIDFTGLKEIYIVLEERKDMAFLDALLKKVSNLDILAVKSMFLSTDLNISDLMQIPSLAHIRELKLEYSREGKWDRPQHLLTATCNTLQTLQNKDELEKLSIKIRCLTVSKDKLTEGLESLDLLLADPQFRSLTRVALCIEPAYEFPGDDSLGLTPTTRENLIRHLQRLDGHPYRGFTFKFIFKNFGSS